jgi:hypothetical protein
LHPPGKQQLIPRTANAETTDVDDDVDNCCVSGGEDDNEAVTAVCLDEDTRQLSLLDLAIPACRWMWS